MPRCNCGARCNCFVEAGEGVTVSGVGTSAQPYVISSGGGGVIDSYMYIVTDDVVVLLDSVPTTVPVDSASYGGLVFVQRGSDISWDIGNPTRVNILTTGVYDLEGSLLFTNPGESPIIAHTYISKNGGIAFGSDGFQLMANPVGVLPAPASTAGAGFYFNGLDLTAGDYLELTAYAVGPDLFYSSGGITVTRRI